MRTSTLVSAVLFLLVFTPGLHSADWPGHGGPDGSGISGEKDWNPAALKKKKTLWQTQLGKGYSAFSVKGKNAYTMGNDGGKDLVYCLDAETGKAVWTFSYDCAEGNYPGPRSTPLVDEKGIFVIGREGQVICLDESGKEKWTKHLAKDFGMKPPKWSFSGSARSFGDTIIINAGKHGLALGKSDGKLVWASPKEVCGYSTPVLYRQGEVEAAAICGQKEVYGVDAKTGKVLWSYPWETKYDVLAADPLIMDGKAFVSSDYGKGCSLFDISKEKTSQLWENKSLASHFSPTLLIGDHVYGIDGNANSKGKLVCLSVKTGEVKWSMELGFGSLTAANGHLIVLNDRGTLHIVEASPDGYKEISKSPILPAGAGAKCWTAPVLSGGRIFCRNDIGMVACVDVRK